MTAWITMIPDEEAGPELRAMLDTVRTPHGTVDNVMRIHSHRPHGMVGHVALYRAVLHNPANTLPLSFLETVAVYTSVLNDCAYSLAHHFDNFRRLLGDDDKANAALTAFHARRPEDVFPEREWMMLRYVEKLTTAPGKMIQKDVADLHEVGCTDGEILEINQVCAYFNFSNRLLNGLGVTTAGDRIGYYEDGAA